MPRGPIPLKKLNAMFKKRKVLIRTMDPAGEIGAAKEELKHGVSNGFDIDSGGMFMRLEDGTVYPINPTVLSDNSVQGIVPGTNLRRQIITKYHCDYSHNSDASAFCPKQ